MSASATVPLTITYAPVPGQTTTVTVLGQVLNNGGTNWIPTNGHAIYLATTSGAGASQTVLDGATYYVTTGPAVPAQVTISVTPTAGSTSGAATASAAASGSGSSAAAQTSTAAASNSQPASSSSAAAASPSSSSSSSSGVRGKPVNWLVCSVVLVGALGLLWA